MTITSEKQKYSTIVTNLCVQVRFTRAFKGLISPPSEPPGEIMSFGVSPVNYSDSDSEHTLQSPVKFIKTCCQSRPRGYKTYFMLSSPETKIYPAHKC